MSNDDIIRMAQQTLPIILHRDEDGRLIEQLTAFAALVAAAERKKIELDGIHTCSNECQRPVCVAVREAVAAEREACAKVCDDIDNEYEGEDVLASWCAAAIRARGQQ